MKNTHLLFLCSFVLISCSNINSNVTKKDFKSGLSNFCSDTTKSSVDIKSFVDVPDVTDASAPPPRENLKQIENTSPPYVRGIEVLKDNAFLTVYGYPVPNVKKIVGKIFNQSGEEVVKRFEIADNKDLSGLKIITDKNIDHFFVIYNKKNDSGFFLRKFDLKGNKLNEIKIENATLGYDFKNVSFSVDENGNNLILSWMSLEFFKEVSNDPYPCPSSGTCTRPGVVIIPDIFYHPIANIVKFDNQLNYCVTKLGFDEEFKETDEIFTSYITKKRDKVIFPISYEKITQIDLKDNSLKYTYFDSKLANNGEKREQIYTAEDNNDFYFFSRSIVYKTNNMLEVISSKEINETKLEDIDPNSITDKIDNVNLPYFFNNQLDIFYKTDNSFMIPNSTVKLGNNFLVVEDGNYFKIVDNLTP